MANAVSCGCGWHEHGTDEELVDAFVRHVEEAHGKQISREAAATQIKQEEGE